MCKYACVELKVSVHVLLYLLRVHQRLVTYVNGRIRTASPHFDSSDSEQTATEGSYGRGSGGGSSKVPRIYYATRTHSQIAQVKVLGETTNTTNTNVCDEGAS